MLIFLNRENRVDNMSYKNWERKKEKEQTPTEISESHSGTGKVFYWKEKKPVKINRREIYVHYNDQKAVQRDKAYTVKLINGQGRKDILDKFRSKSDAEDDARSILRDVTDDPSYRSKVADKLEFEMIESGLGQEDKVVQTNTIKWDSDNRSQMMDKYFHSDEDYVMEKVENQGTYGEAVGQGLRARVVAK